MESFRETIELRNGKAIVLRPMVAGDADALHQYFVGLPEETRRYLRDDVIDQAVIRKWAEELDHDRVLPILAFDGETVVGDGTLHLPTRKWQRHLCEIRVTVARDYRRQGLGTALVWSLIRAATARNLQKCVVQVMAEEKAALNVFQSLGFHIESVLDDFAIDAADRLQNVIVLCNNIEELWERMEDLMMNMDIGRL